MTKTDNLGETIRTGKKTRKVRSNVIDGAIAYSMVGHSLVSGGLFLVIGYIGEITGTRMIAEIRERLEVNGRGALGWMIIGLILCNGSMPLTVLFVTELL